MQRQRGRVLQVSQEQTATQTGSADAVGALNVEGWRGRTGERGDSVHSLRTTDGSFSPSDGERGL